MKKLKYLVAIIVIFIIVFIGIELFRKGESEENNLSTNTNISTNAENTANDNINISQEQNTTIGNTNTTENNSTSNTTENTNNVISKPEEITTGQELMQKADKTISATGWAGASNNVIALKDGIIYYYNKSSEEFYKIAEGIEDIYYKNDFSEEITAKKDENFKEFKEAPTFLVYE